MKHSKEEYRKAYRNLFLILALVIIASVLLGCKAKEMTTTMETVRTDTVYKSTTKLDSIYIHDSIWQHEWTVGDTVYMERVKYQTRWRDRLMRDTIYLSRADTVKIERTIEKAYRLAWWKKALMDIGGICVVAISSAVCVYLFRKKLPF